MNNNNDILHDVSYYLGLAYTVVLKKDDEGDFVARIEELPGCAGHGANEVEALECLRSMQEAWISDCIDVGDPVPVPVQDEALPSGKWVQRVPRSLHKKLVAKARQDQVSLNQLVTSLLAEAIGQSSCVMKTMIDNALALHAGMQPVRFATKHVDIEWRGFGDWQTRPTSGTTEVQTQLSEVVKMMTPETCTVLFHDNKKEASDPWRSVR